MIVGCLLSLPFAHLVGSLLLLKHALSSFWLLYPLLRARLVSIDEEIASKYGKGSWVLVTGASDGIGLAFARHFAGLGFNIVLVSRDRARTEEAAKGVREAGLARGRRVETRVLVKDFRESLRPGFFAEFESLFSELEFSIIVNCVGVSVIEKSFSETLEDTSLRTLADGVAINCAPQVVLHSLSERFRRKGKNRFALIDVSSLNSDLYLNPGEVYSSTKAFNRYFTVSRASRAPAGVDYLCCLAGPVETSILKHLPDFNPRFLPRISPDKCVRDLLASLGRVGETPGAAEHVFFGAAHVIFHDVFEPLYLTIKKVIRYYLVDRKRTNAN